MSIDELHENTYKYIKNSQINFENQLLEIGKERGMIVDLNDDMKSNVCTLVTKFLFHPIENDKDGKKFKERLFSFKLAVFENEAIRKSQDRELKAKLRKAESIEEVIQCTYEMLRG